MVAYHERIEKTHNFAEDAGIKKSRRYSWCLIMYFIYLFQFINQHILHTCITFDKQYEITQLQNK